MNKGLTKIEIQKFWGVFHIFWWRNYGIRESPQNKTILQIESESMWGENVKWEAPFSTRSNIFEWVLHLKDTAILKVESSILQIRYTNRHWPKSPEIHWYRHWRIKKAIDHWKKNADDKVCIDVQPCFSPYGKNISHSPSHRPVYTLTTSDVYSKIRKVSMMNKSYVQTTPRIQLVEQQQQLGPRRRQKRRERKRMQKVSQVR